MQVYNSTGEIPYRKESVVTLGTFDGIHVGHKKIIEELNQRAKKRDARSVLITFYPHPQTVVGTHKRPIRLLTTLKEKLTVLDGLDLDAVLVLPFTKALSRIAAEDFVETILAGSVGLTEFIFGYNHAFGKNRRGDAALLERLGKKYDFIVDMVPAVIVDEAPVSSTRIRNLLTEGCVVQANRLLGRPYTLEGVVRQGRRLGEKLGFPTANLEVDGEYKLIPGDGVYAVFVDVKGNQFPGMANVGYRPTVDGEKHGVEVHIHDFSGDLYGKKIKLAFIDRIRDEKKFDSVDMLVSQMEQDRKHSIDALSKKSRR